MLGFLALLLSAATPIPTATEPNSGARIVFCHFRKALPPSQSDASGGIRYESSTHYLVIMHAPARSGVIDPASFKAHDPDNILLGMTASAIKYDAKKRGHLVQLGSLADPRESLVIGLLPDAGSALLNGHLARPFADEKTSDFSYFFAGLCDAFDSEDPARDFEMMTKTSQ